MARRPLGRDFAWLWGAYAVSTMGTWLAFDALPLIAILVLHAGPGAVSTIAAAGLAVAAVVAVPLGPWVEFHRKRPVMVAMDLIRFAAMVSVPVAFAVGHLTIAQLVVVAVIVGSADIAFKAASGACIKALVAPDDLLVASARLESTSWTATTLGPPLGGLAIGIFGPVTTVIADALSYVASALALTRVTGPVAAPSGRPRLRPRDLADGWRYILGHSRLRGLFLNSILVSGLIMATLPLIAVLMLGHLGFAPWQYGFAFGVPCVGGLIGSRLSSRLVARFGRDRILRRVGTLRACWSVGLAFIPGGAWGIALVVGLQFGIVTCMGIYTPVYAALRLEATESDRVARVLGAWSVTSSASIAVLTALWGALATVAGLRVAIGLAGLLLLATPLLLPRDAEVEVEVTGHSVRDGATTSR